MKNANWYIALWNVGCKQNTDTLYSGPLNSTGWNCLAPRIFFSKFYSRTESVVG